MPRIRRLQLMFILALVVGGLALTAVPYVPQVAGSKGDMGRNGRESSYQISFTDDEEIIEQVASSKGGRADAARESSIASSAGGRASPGRESASLPTQAEELQQVAGSAGERSKTAGRESA